MPSMNEQITQQEAGFNFATLLHSRLAITHMTNSIIIQDVFPSVLTSHTGASARSRGILGKEGWQQDHTLVKSEGKTRRVIHSPQI